MPTVGAPSRGFCVVLSFPRRAKPGWQMDFTHSASAPSWCLGVWSSCRWAPAMTWSSSHRMTTPRLVPSRSHHNRCMGGGRGIMQGEPGAGVKGLASLTLPSRQGPVRPSPSISLARLPIVDTIFGHVSLDAHLELMKCRSVGGKMVTSLQESCRWGLVPMGKRQDMTKSRSGDGFVPMTSIDGCRWLWKVVYRWLWRKAQGLLIDSWWCTDRLWKII